MKCFFCKGDMKNEFTTHVVDFDKCIIVIKKVPCLKCQQCGEVAFNGTVVKQLEEITKMAKTSLTEIAIVNYSDKIVA